MPSAEGAAALPLPQCRAERLRTRTNGVLTVGTGSVPDPPWFASSTPADGKGLDAAVLREVAATLGFRPDQVRWRTGSGLSDLNAGAVDVLIGQWQIPEESDTGQDWSTGYYDLTTAVVAPTGSQVAGAPSTAALAGRRIGVVTDSADADAVRAVVPGAKIVAFPDLAAALGGLSAGRVDAVAMPTWRATASAAKDRGIAVLGSLPTGSMQPLQLGIALRPGSALTPCVSAAVDAIRVQGDLDSMAKTWIGDVPVLK